MGKVEYSLQITITTTNFAYVKDIMSKLRDIIPVDTQDLDVIIDYSVKTKEEPIKL